jgi:hypothetical protein
MKNSQTQNHAGFCYVFAGLLLLSSNLAYGGYRDDVGQLQLVDELGANTPDGTGVKVTAVDCCAGPSGDDYAIDPSYFEFAGKTITNVSPVGTGFSDHAREVGSYFFGNNTSLAPGILDIDAYENRDFAINFLGVNSQSTGPRPHPLISIQAELKNPATHITPVVMLLVLMAYAASTG